MEEPQENQTLTRLQLERIEKNRERAIKLKQSRLVVHPYSKTEVVCIDKTSVKIGTKKYKDTGGGFLLEEEPDQPEEPVKITADEPPIIDSDRPTCEKCDNLFASSWLYDCFECKVCDSCKDTEEEHKLITKTEAMNEYLLKDCDLDKREPPLKFIKKKNPHNVRWGEMKLYLQLQVEKRALEVWGSEENLQEEIEKREEKRVMAKAKKYHKQMTALRMNMRSSLYDKTSSASHMHEFGPESYNEEDDTYSHVCISCKFEETFEKM